MFSVVTVKYLLFIYSMKKQKPLKKNKQIRLVKTCLIIYLNRLYIIKKKKKNLGIFSTP